MSFTGLSPRSAIVLGSGVGGLCAAARLSAQGVRVTVLERMRHVGGRFSTREIEGFKLPTGAFMIAIDDPLAWTFRDLGIEFPVREADERPAYLIEGEIVEIGERGGLRTLVAAAARHDDSDADRVMQAIREALGDWENGQEPSGDEELPAWLARHGAGPTVIAVFESNTRAYLGVNAREVTIRAFLDYLTVTSGNARYGVPPEGGISVTSALADYVRGHGGSVLCQTPAARLLVDDGREGVTVVGVEDRAGTQYHADLVVSGLGLEATIALAPDTITDLIPVPPEQRNAPGVTSFIASREPFFDHLSVTVVGSRCVCIVTTPTLLAPELAPDGWHFTESLSTFESSREQADPKAELARHMADLDELMPQWRRRGRLLQTSTYRGVWPVVRTWMGHDSDNRFPVPGLALVGDSIKGPGWTGVGASADGARILAESAS